MSGVTLYKERADPCEEHSTEGISIAPTVRRCITEWPSKESHSCLLAMQITYGHTTTLTTKPTGIE